MKYNFTPDIPENYSTNYLLYKDKEHMFTTTQNNWRTAFALLKESYPLSTVECVIVIKETIKRG